MPSIGRHIKTVNWCLPKISKHLPHKKSNTGSQMSDKEMTLKELLDNIDLTHFYNGWNMWPEWWTKSTPSWQLGYKLRENQEETSTWKTKKKY